MSMDHILERPSSVIDLFNPLVRSTLGINDPPRKLHLRSRFCIFQSCNAMDCPVTGGKALGLVSGFTSAIILGHMYFLDLVSGGLVTRCAGI